jgi:TIR domain
VIVASPVKVFISFASADGGDLARRLLADLQNAGADVFQFEESARPGDAAWSQVATKIKVADWFVLLATKKAAASKPVRAEIEIAFNAHVNSEDNRPSIVPVQIGGADVPDLVEHLTKIEFTSASECSRKLLKLLRLEQTDGEAEVRGSEIGCLLTVAPRRARVGEAVYWTATAENRSGGLLRDVVMRLDDSTIAGPVDIKAGKNLSQDVAMKYHEPGPRSRTLSVLATDPEGRAISASARRTVKVESAVTTPGQGGWSPSAPTLNRDELQRLLRGNTPSTRSGTRPGPAFGTVPPLRSSMSGTAAPVVEPDPGVGGMLAAGAGVGAVMAIGAFFAVRMIVPWLGDVDAPDWVWWLPTWFSDWPTWVQVVVGLAGLAVLTVLGIWRADSILVVDALDASNASFTAGLAAIAGALAWAFVSLNATGVTTLAWQAVFAVTATTAGVLAYIVFEEL